MFDVASVYRRRDAVPGTKTPRNRIYRLTVLHRTSSKIWHELAVAKEHGAAQRVVKPHRHCLSYLILLPYLTYQPSLPSKSQGTPSSVSSPTGWKLSVSSLDIVNRRHTHFQLTLYNTPHAVCTAVFAQPIPDLKAKSRRSTLSQPTSSPTL